MFIGDTGTAVGGHYFGDVDDGNKRGVISHCQEIKTQFSIPEHKAVYSSQKESRQNKLNPPLLFISLFSPTTSLSALPLLFALSPSLTPSHLTAC